MQVNIRDKKLNYLKSITLEGDITDGDRPIKPGFYIVKRYKEYKDYVDIKFYDGTDFDRFTREDCIKVFYTTRITYEDLITILFKEDINPFEMGRSVIIKGLNPSHLDTWLATCLVAIFGHKI